MAIQKSDRALVATLAMIYIHSQLLKGRDPALEEGVIIGQKLLEVIDHRLPNKARRKV